MKIDKYVPMPTKAKQKYPFPMMDVGDSFKVEEVIKCRAAACAWGKNNNSKFSVKRMDDGSYRCWRIA